VAHPFARHHSSLFRVALFDYGEGDGTSVEIDGEVDWFLGLLLHL
jgi:hypothetical protein